MRRKLAVLILGIIAAALLVVAGIRIFTPPPPAAAPAPLPTIASTSPSGSSAPASATTEAPPSSQEEAAIKAATVMSTWNPAKDFNRTDSELRARTLMTQSRAEKVLAPQRPATGQDWLAAAAAKATSVPTVSLNRATEKNITSVTTTWVWKTADGKILDLPAEQRTYYFQFTTTTPHKISDYTYE